MQITHTAVLCVEKEAGFAKTNGLSKQRDKLIIAMLQATMRIRDRSD